MPKTIKTKFYQQLGENLRDARKASNLNQDVLASYLEMSRASVVNIEKGRQHPPIHLLVEIARILNVDVCSLIPRSSSKGMSSETDWKKIVGESVKGTQKEQDIILGFLKQITIEK